MLLTLGAPLSHLTNRDSNLGNWLEARGQGGHDAVPRGQPPGHRQCREGWGGNLGEGWKVLSRAVPLSLGVGVGTWLGCGKGAGEIPLLFLLL